MTLDAQFKLVRETGSSKNKKQHTIGCEYSWIQVDNSQSMIYQAAGVLRELRDQFLDARIGKPLWSTEAFVCTVREIEHQGVVSSGIIADEFSDENLWERTRQA